MSLLILALASALASPASAIPDDLAFSGRVAAYARPESIEIVDAGAGDVAMVFVARKDDFAPWKGALLATSAVTPRVLAILLGDDAFSSLTRDGALPELLEGILRSRGVESSCIVTCGDCAFAAASATERLDMVEGVVLLGEDDPPALQISIPMLVARDLGASLKEAAGETLGLSPETLRRLRMEARLVPVIP